MAAERLQQGMLVRGLDPLGDDGLAEAAAEAGDGIDDRRVGGIVLEPANEAAVDLYDVDRELLEMRERGEAGAEIVERDRDPLLVQHAQRALDIFGAAADEHALGHFELEAGRRNARLGEPLEQALGEVAAAELGGGGVDRDMAKGDALIAPASDVVDHRLDHPVADQGGNAEILEGGRHARRLLDAAGRMLPAHQSLEADRAAGPELDLGLVI